MVAIDGRMVSLLDRNTWVSRHAGISPFWPFPARVRMGRLRTGFTPIPIMLRPQGIERVTRDNG